MPSEMSVNSPETKPRGKSQPFPVRLLLRLAGLLVLGGVAFLVTFATRDCREAVGVWNNCFWIYLRQSLGLGESRLLKVLVLEGVGISLVAMIWIAFRYLLPVRLFRRDS